MVGKGCDGRRSKTRHEREHYCFFGQFSSIQESGDGGLCVAVSGSVGKALEISAWRKMCHSLSKNEGLREVLIPPGAATAGDATLTIGPMGSLSCIPVSQCPSS